MAVTKMDWQKNLLIAAMIAVVLMLVIRWNQFQENLAIANPAVSQAGIGLPVVDNTSDLPNLTATDLPSASSNTPAPATEATTLIQVKTDSLQVVIDPRGGDILQVALPRHYAALNTPDVPFILLDKRADHTYIAQSGLIGRNGTDLPDGSRPLFQASQSVFEMEKNEDQLQVDLVYQQDKVKITKRFTFTRGDYLINLEYLVDNQSETSWNAALYGQIRRDGQNLRKSRAFEMNPYLGAAITTPDTNYKKVSFKDMDSSPFSSTHQGGWVAMVQHYFVSAWIPDTQTENTYQLRRSNNDKLYLLGFNTPVIQVEPGQQGRLYTGFYAGPKDTKRLEEISPFLDLTVDYGWLWWLAKPLFLLLKLIHNLVGNWGLAIIGLTLLVKLAFFKLSAASYKSMAKMRKLAPKLQDLKERFGDDRQKMSQEMMKLYKTEKVNPLGGCLPVLVQMPVFLALYWTLMESVELRHAPFFLWIQDLSVKDPFFILPLIMGLTMFIQMKLNPTPPDPMQARVMQIMPVMFTFLFLWFPAGLVLYWVTNNTLGILQQWIITRQIEKADAKA
jgi:YidC/Oxa1 family membrane protein insertase